MALLRGHTTTEALTMKWKDLPLRFQTGLYSTFARPAYQLRAQNYQHYQLINNIKFPSTIIFKQPNLTLRLTKGLYSTYNYQNIWQNTESMEFINPTWTNILWPKTHIMASKIITKWNKHTRETQISHPIPTKNHDHTHQGIKNIFNMTLIFHSEEN